MAICSYPTCERAARSLGYCHRHWQQFDQGIELTHIPGRVVRDAICTFDGCGRKHVGLGLCKPHRRQLAAGEALRPIKDTQTERVTDSWKKMAPEERARRKSGLNSGDYVRSAEYRKRLSDTQKARYAAGQGRSFKDKTCVSCGRTFAPNSGRQVHCRQECMQESAVARRYGLTAVDLADRLEQQGGVCALCKKSARLHVDHDHQTGQFRGLLCINCNTGLGKLGDSPELLRLAADYIESHR